MDPVLNEVEARVIGALIEKKLTTPEYYPLSLNSLTTACNQKSNRDPVVDFDEKTVVRALDALKDRELARQLSGADMRVPRYYHRLDEVLSLSEKEVAILGELLLRGPQTVGELRGRANRMVPLADLTEAEGVLEGLAARESGPMVARLPRQPGRKESRWAQLLTGEPAIEATPEEEPEAKPERATVEVRAENERLAALEDQVASLEGEMAALRQQFQEFKEQFD
jgi:uncharacterized protein YceH (UPF0502 family)